MNCFQNDPVRVIKEVYWKHWLRYCYQHKQTTLNKIFEAAMLRPSTCNSCYNNVS